jgi:hypothetical protein
MTNKWMKFWPSNWLGDAQLRLCSLESKGLFIDCLCLMHEAQRRGYLETSMGKPICDDMLARLTGTFKGDVYRCKQELIDSGVVSVDEKGIIYSRKMVRESQKAEKCSEAGRRGGGNPLLNEEDESIEDKKIEDICTKGTFKGDVCKTNGGLFESFWNCYPVKKGKAAAKKSFARAVKSASPDEIIAAVEKQKRWPEWVKDNGAYIPHPATWLNQGRWSDEPKNGTGRRPLSATERMNMTKEQIEAHENGGAF